MADTATQHSQALPSPPRPTTPPPLPAAAWFGDTPHHNLPGAGLRTSLSHPGWTTRILTNVIIELIFSISHLFQVTESVGQAIVAECRDQYYDLQDEGVLMILRLVETWIRAGPPTAPAVLEPLLLLVKRATINLFYLYLISVSYTHLTLPTKA